ncbi:MAG: FliH/SctL family protein [Sphingomonadales bacterium]
MTKAVKFTFDNAFDADCVGIGPDEVYYDRSPKYGEKDIEKARDEAYAEGVTSGIQQSLASFESQMTATLNRLNEAVAVLVNERQALAIELRQEAAMLAHAIAGKLAQALMRNHSLAEIEAVVRECMTEQHGEPRIVIRLNSAQLDDVKKRIDTVMSELVFGGDVVLLADEAVAPGDCMVEWADGGAERDTEQLSKAADYAVSRYLNQLLTQPAQLLDATMAE